MNKWLTLICISLCSVQISFSQDTFSIVALDSATGEVGSAGASCVDLFSAGLPNDDFLGQLLPDVGAINTQAYYLPENQDTAMARMMKGDTPSQIISYMVANDFQAQPEIRQYGIVGFVNGSPQAAAHTGTGTNNYKGHNVGPNYSIQGNILLGQQVLDSMEARFLRQQGDLACKLMAALQGANMVGADTRCQTNGSSSLFAFVKVAQPTDVFGSPSFLVSVRTRSGDKIEPIDSLQSMFNAAHSCPSTGILKNSVLQKEVQIFPNPGNGQFQIYSPIEVISLSVISVDGQTVYQANTNSKEITLVLPSGIPGGMYFVSLKTMEGVGMRRIVLR